MRLIDADALCETLTKKEEFYHNGKDYNTASVIHMVKEIYVRNEPTVDTERHGHWLEKEIYDGNNLYHIEGECSVCHNTLIYNSNYCPHCGAKMDDEVEE